MSLFGGVTTPGAPDLANIAVLDCLPIPMIRKMTRAGIAMDIPYLTGELNSRLTSEMGSLAADISSYIPAERLYEFLGKADRAEAEAAENGRGDYALINANSHDQIRVLIFDLLNLGRGKKLAITDSGTVSTGRKNLEACRDEHPVIPKILAYRERAKLKQTYIDSLPRLAKFHPKGRSCPVCELDHVESTYRIHSEFTTTRAETGRLSSKKPNLQNIPLKTKLGALVRAAFVASPGRKLVSVDFAQIELRDLAHAANCQSMIEVYLAGGDIHLDTTLRCFPHVTKADAKKPQYRVPSKIGNFSVAYQIGAPSFQSGLYLAFGSLFNGGDIDEPTYRSLIAQWEISACEQFIADWFNTRPEVREWLDVQAYRARRYGFIWDLFGRVRRVPEVRSYHHWKQQEGVRQAGNMPIQSLSAGQTKLAMGELDEEFARLREAGVWVWPLVPVHDQIISEVDEEYAEEVGEIKMARFNSVMEDRETGQTDFRVPVKSDAEITTRWVKE